MKTALLKTAMVLFSLASAFLPGRASAWWSVNVDVATIAEVAALHAAVAGMEAEMRLSAEKTLEYYRKGGIASTAIFMSKYMDRRAMTSLGLWSSEENYYYSMIRSKLVNHLFPRIYGIARQMVKDPQNAIIWMQYMGRLCKDIQGLCAQFESIVTNSQLSFKDLAFPQVKAEIMDRMEALGLSDGRLLEIIRNLPSVREITRAAKEKFSPEQLDMLRKKIEKQLADYLHNPDPDNPVVNLVNTIAADSVRQSPDQLFAAIGDALRQAESQGFGSWLQSMTAAAAGAYDPSRLFDNVALAIADWAIDWRVSPDSMEAFTQRWQIVRKSTAENKTLASFYPKAFASLPKDPNGRKAEGWFFAVANGDVQTAERQARAYMEERIKPWTDEKVAAENAASDGSYAIEKTIQQKKQEVFTDLSTGSETTNPSAPNIRYSGTWYAYSAIVRQKAQSSDVVLLDTVFDSGANMVEEAFASEIEAIAAYYEDEDARLHGGTPQNKYEIKKYEKKGYTKESAATIRGCESVTIYVTCHENAEIASGTTRWKCWHDHEDKFTEQAKECAYSNGGSEDSSIEQLEAELEDLRRQKEELRQRLSEIPAEKEAAIAAGDTERLQALIAEEQSKQTIYASLIEGERGLESEIEEMRNESLASADWTESGRIQDLMGQMSLAFAIKWDDAGSWDNASRTFTATGSSVAAGGMGPNTLKYVFTAKLRCDKKRGPYIILGYVHRNRMSLEYSLRSSGTTKTIYDVLIRDGDPFDQSDDEKYADLVEQRKAEARADNPGCDISVEKIVASSDTIQETKETYHLVWSADRLRIAREVLARLTRLQGDLIALERLVNMRQDWLGALRRMAPLRLDYRMEERTAAQQAAKTWLQNAQQAPRRKNTGPDAQTQHPRTPSPSKQ